MKLVIASANPSKAAEIVELLEVIEGIELCDRPEALPEPVEDGATLLENARIKARSVVVATGMAAVADDTGLEVMALGGAPGVHTARYAGPGASDDENITKLLGELSDIQDPDQRYARWRTVALVSFPDGREIVTEGVCEGRIALEPWGSNGFGYDPVFIPQEGDGRTFAEMSSGEKHQLSHRGKAFGALADQIEG